MNNQPYIVSPGISAAIKEERIGELFTRLYIDKPSQLSFGIIDFVPKTAVSLHIHNTWELVLVDSISEGPGYVFFDGNWWQAAPGCGVYMPKGHPHAWSAGNNNGFKMLYIYGGSREEAGRVWTEEAKTFQPITTEEERKAILWTI